MNIDWVIPCRFAEVHDNLGTIVGAGIDNFWRPQLPAPMQVVMAIRLTGLPDEVPGLHRFQNIVRAPGGETLHEQEIEIGFGGGQLVERPDYLMGVMLASVTVFTAEVEGTYTVEFILDRSSTRAVPLHVINAPPPGAAAA